MRRKLVAGNWKMNLTIAEAAAVVESFISLVDQKQDVDIVLCPPYLALARVKELLKKAHVQLGAQDVFWKDAGAFTGNISAPMLRDAGVEYVIIGHSETRGRFGKLEVPESTIPYFAETDETVNLKIKASLSHGLVPILCVGESLAEREAGETDAVIQAQLRGALGGIEDVEFAAGVVAYEPVWAIGTGKVCDTDEAERVCGMIRATLAEIYNGETADQIRVLYGGSVNAGNSKALFGQPNIDGGLVGGASLDPSGFSHVVLNA